MSEAQGHEYLKTHDISGDFLTLNIAEESRVILDAARAASTGHTAKTLVKDGPLRVVILGFRAGSALREHDAAGPLSIHVLSGDVEVSSGDRTDSLGEGGVLVLGSAVPHSVAARSDAVVLLTIAWPQR